MDRSQEKIREKAQKFKIKGQYQKARAILDDAGTQVSEVPELAAEVVGLSFVLDPWTESLEVLKKHLGKHSITILCGGENRTVFTKLIHEHGGFAGGLTHHLLLLRDFESLAGWVSLSDNYDQRWLVRQWAQAANEEKRDRTRAGLLMAAAGVGLFAMDNMDAAWSQWQQALQREPRLLKRLMAFCQQPGRLESTRLNDRLLLIKLIAASGKKNETLSLLKAVGLESHENALRVLNEIPEFLPGEVTSKDVVTLRFTLALSLQDPEILASVISGMGELTEADLFRYKKLAMGKIADAEVKRRVMLCFVQLYFSREEWEAAGLLLESLYMESPHQEIVTLMEQVLDRYPIMSQLHFTAGKFYLDLENYDKAVFHLGTILQVDEYETEIRGLLEEHLSRVYDGGLAEMLLGMLNPTSHKAGLLAFWILSNESEELEKHISLWAQPKFSDESSPFWHLALVNGYIRMQKFADALPVLARFIQKFPKLSSEALRPAEIVAGEHHGDFTEITRAVEDNLDKLQPRNAWSGLRMNFIEKTQNYKRQTAVDPRQLAGAPSMPDTRDGVSPEVTSLFTHFKTLLDAGNWNDAGELAQKVVRDYPQSAGSVLRYLDSLHRQFPHQTIWVRTMVSTLISLKQYGKAVEIGTHALAGPGNQSELPELYQVIADAYKGMGSHSEALRFYCLASRSPRLYERNSSLLAESVLPHFPQYLKDIIQLVLINEDQGTWETLMKNWYHHRPEELDHLIKAQKSFAGQVNTTQSILDLAYWHLQNGQAAEVNQALNRLDLSDPEILESLVSIADLISLKFPNDPKPKFLLGKYYLIQGDINKAVDIFRELAKQIPNVAETIYHQLRTFLRSNPTSGDKSRLYGLLIRFALDYGTPLAAVKLLEEFGRQDRAGALQLVDGVHRVIVNRKNHLEAAFEILRQLFAWHDFARLLDYHQKGNYGTHMPRERARWFEEIRRLQPELADRATLASAHLCCETYEFDKCRQTLMQIQDPEIRQEALPVYEKLVDRFKEDFELWREAGWTAFLVDEEKAVYFFTHLLSAPGLEARTEAYGLLKELGRDPEWSALEEIENEPGRIYAGLHQTYMRVRETELEFWTANSRPVPARVLSWLIGNGNWKRYKELLPRLAEKDEAARARLDFELLRNIGQWTRAARRLSGAPVSTSYIQRAFYDAGMIERAVQAGDGSERLPTHIREAFLSSFGQTRMIRPTIEQIRNLQRVVSRGPDAITTLFMNEVESNG